VHKLYICINKPKTNIMKKFIDYEAIAELEEILKDTILTHKKSLNKTIKEFLKLDILDIKNKIEELKNN